MSSVHCIVVWEWQREGLWLPHTPGVTRTLERAHAKKLTRVVLADADPALKGHYVNLRTLTQCIDSPDGSSVECPVRRARYDAASPGARGLRWEWAPLLAPPHAAGLVYEPMPMEMQCVVEAAWAAGATACAWGGWCVSPARLAARSARGLRLLRRAAAPPYPRAPPPAPAPPAAPPVDMRDDFIALNTTRRPRIPQQHTGSSVQSVQSIHSVQSLKSLRAPPPRPLGRGGARSASPPRKPGLARQILHNLNIFSAGSKPGGFPRPPAPRAGSERAGRRHSVDTVSTYLSHESKDSLQRGSVGELLDCSAGSDDVFDEPRPGCERDQLPAPESECASASPPASPLPWGHGVARVGPAWGAVCPACLLRLRAGPGLLRLPRPAPRPAPCQAARDNREELYIECLICGQVSGQESPERAERAGAGAEAGAVCGPQPAGSMAWSLQPASLPAFPRHPTILVTYSFQSGVQSAGHPLPGAPYYAVGFPRHSLLPDTPAGREVLSLLRAAWGAGALFGVSASRTTGREHVVAWRAPPPPAARAHYPPTPAPAARLLAAAAAGLRALAPHA